MCIVACDQLNLYLEDTLGESNLKLVGYKFKTRHSKNYVVEAFKKMGRKRRDKPV